MSTGRTNKQVSRSLPQEQLSSGCARRSTRHARLAWRARSAASRACTRSTKKRLLAASTRRRRLEARCSPGAPGSCATRAREPLRALHRRRAHPPAQSPSSSCSTTWPPTELDLAQVAELVEGAAEVFREAGCAPLGGESAEEVPRCVTRARARLRRHVRSASSSASGLIDGSPVRARATSCSAFPSSGLHTNGFSLVLRRLMAEGFDAEPAAAGTAPGST